MAQYILRDPPKELWDRVVSQSQVDGWPLQRLIMELLRDYVEGRIKPSTPAPRAPLRRRPAERR